MIGKTIGELHEGDSAELVRAVEQGDVLEFIDAVGDYNPLHSDPEYAARTQFKGIIAPGIFTAGMISAVIGTQLPGPGAIYLSQSLKFLKPVKPGDVITAHVQVAEVIRERNRLRLTTSCTNQRGEEVLSGDAWVMPSRTAVVYDKPPARTESAEQNPLGALAMQPFAWAAEAMACWGRLGLSLLPGGGSRRS